MQPIIATKVEVLGAGDTSACRRGSPFCKGASATTLRGTIQRGGVAGAIRVHVGMKNATKRPRHTRNGN